jgi:hypothetical protein
MRKQITPGWFIRRESRFTPVEAIERALFSDRPVVRRNYKNIYVEHHQNNNNLPKMSTLSYTFPIDELKDRLGRFGWIREVGCFPAHATVTEFNVGSRGT